MQTTLQNARTRTVTRWMTAAGLIAAACAAATTLTGCQSGGRQSSGEAASYQTGHTLGDFVGSWNITGWEQVNGSERRTIAGTARSVRDKNYFVRMDLTFPDPTSSVSVDGTCIFAQGGGRSVELTTWFSSSPTMRRYDGTMNAEGTLIEFQDRRGDERRILKLKLNGSNSWEAEVWQGERQIELYAFTRSGT